jgi:hypothetical protein
MVSPHHREVGAARLAAVRARGRSPSGMAAPAAEHSNYPGKNEPDASDEEWIARIEAWQVNPACWNIEEDGPPPNDPNHRIPLDVVGRFKDRQAREAKEREKREGAAAASRPRTSRWWHFRSAKKNWPASTPSR